MQPHLVNLASECIAYQIGTAVHELLHALGFIHEQSRPDRDYNIYIAKENLLQGAYSQFEKNSYNTIDTSNTYYDFGSVMHYSTHAFSKNDQPTIIPRIQVPSNVVIGQREKMSVNDIKEVNALYRCNLG